MQRCGRRLAVVQVQPATLSLRLRSGVAGLVALAEGAGLIWPRYPATIVALVDGVGRHDAPVCLTLPVISVADCVYSVIYKRRAKDHALAGFQALIICEHNRANP